MAQALKAQRRPAPSWGFGDRLRLVRRDLGLTQAEMAIRIGVGLKSYSSWESGQARPADLTQRATQLEAATGIVRAWWIGWGDDGPGEELPHLDSNQEPAENRSHSARWVPSPYKALRIVA